MAKDQAPGAARLADRFGQALLALLVVGAIAFVVLLVRGSTARLTVYVPASQIESLPSNAALIARAPIDVTVRDPSAKQSALILLAAAVPYGLLLFVVAELRKIVGTVRRGDPFVQDNVRRLRWIGTALIVGAPLGQIFTQLFSQAVAESAGVHSFSSHYDLPPALSIVGIGVLVLAHVFANGVRLREDVEGTV